MYKNFILLSLLLISLLNNHCAQRSSPTGGPKDSIPPELVKTIPSSQTTNFQGKEIKFFFNEYITARSLKENLIINPPIESYTHSTNKNELTITLNDTLRSNTTYTFFLQGGVQDFNEGNPTNKAFLAFSTGNKIDTFKVKGQSINLMNQLPAKNALVALYKINDTLDLLNDKPNYITKTDTSGNFTITNIKKDEYRLLSFKDNNQNLMLDTDEEAYGFVTDTISFINNNENTSSDSLINNDTTKSIKIPEKKIYLFSVNAKPLQIRSSRTSGKYFEVKFNKPIKNYSIEPFSNATWKDSIISLHKSIINKDSVIRSNYIEKQSGIRFYNTFNEDSIQLKLTVKDSINQIISDTINLKFEETLRSKEEFSKSIFEKKEIIKNQISFKLLLNKPLLTLNDSLLQIQFDTLININRNIYNITKINNTKKPTLHISTKVNKDSLLEQASKKQNIKDSLSFLIKLDKEKNLIDSFKIYNDYTSKKTVLNKLIDITNSNKINSTLDSIDRFVAKNNQVNEINKLIDKINRIDSAKLFQNYKSKPSDFTNSKVNFIVEKGGFISVENDSITKDKISFQFVNPENFGTITGKINTDYKSFTVQLLNKNYGIVKEKKDPGDKYKFTYVEPGNYYIRVLIDINNDGKWNIGNIHKNILSEPVYFYPQKIGIRANWELRDINLDF